MPLLDLRQARREVRLADVLELLGWRARARVAAQVRGGCPLHGAPKWGNSSLQPRLLSSWRRCSMTLLRVLTC